MEPVIQRDREWLRTASPAEVSNALAAGQLSQLVGAAPPPDFAAVLLAGEQLTRDDLKSLSSEQIVQAKDFGLLNDVLRITTKGN